MIKYIVEAKRWFDRIYGNTYHSVVITRVKDGKVIYRSGMVYGYGDHYRQTALEALVNKRLLSKTNMYNHELIRKTIHFSVVDVDRKRDLDL